MKKIILFAVSLIFLLNGSFAQKLKWDMDTTKASITADAGINDYEAHAVLTNVNYDFDSFVWIRTNVLKPAAWTSAVCDVNQCYDTIVDSMSFVLKKGEEGNFFFHFYSDDNIGNKASYDLSVYNLKDRANPAVVTAVIYAWTTAVSELDLKKIKLYPNPTINRLNIELPIATVGIIKMDVLNVLGQKVKEINFTGNGSYDVSSLDKGIYFLKFEIDGKQVAKKFQVSK